MDDHSATPADDMNDEEAGKKEDAGMMTSEPSTDEE